MRSVYCIWRPPVTITHTQSDPPWAIMYNLQDQSQKLKQPVQPARAQPLISALVWMRGGKGHSPKIVQILLLSQRNSPVACYWGGDLLEHLCYSHFRSVGRFLSIQHWFSFMVSKASCTLLIWEPRSFRPEKKACTYKTSKHTSSAHETSTPRVKQMHSHKKWLKDILYEVVPVWRTGR